MTLTLLSFPPFLMGWKALKRKYFDCKCNKNIFFPDFKKIITFPLACGGRHLHSFENQRLYHINCWWCLWRSLFISTFLSLFLTAIIIIKFKYYCCGLCCTFLLCSGIAETLISLWTLLIKGRTFMTENYQKNVIVVGSLRAKWKRRHLLWCLLGQRVLLWQSPKVFARSDVNNHNGGLHGRVKITEQKKMFCWNILREKGLPVWSCQPGD